MGMKQPLEDYCAASPLNWLSELTRSALAESTHWLVLAELSELNQAELTRLTESDRAGVGADCVRVGRLDYTRFEPNTWNMGRVFKTGQVYLAVEQLKLNSNWVWV